MSNIDFIKQRAKLARKNVGEAVKKGGYGKFKHSLKKLNIEFGKEVAQGANTIIYLNDQLEKIYGRKNLCLKVFKYNDLYWGRGFSWGESPILESTKAQNLMALNGKAPRVYDLVFVGDKIAQVTDYLKGDQYAVKINDDRFKFNEKEICKSYNFINGKLIDFQAVVFDDYEGYREKIINRANEITQWPHSGKGLYQSLSYHAGKRNTPERLKRYQFSNFEDKLVLDIGCNIGVFCHEALRLGAKRVVGLDTPNIANLASELAILDGYFNIDFYGVDIKTITQEDLIKITGIEKFDIHLFFAMVDWVGFPAWVKNCKKLYFEGHVVERPFKIYNYE